MEPGDKHSNPVGRPRGFCADTALDRALDVFWRKGYEGATLPDLTEAMGINRPSLYAAFGNKEALFRRALDRYAERMGGRLREALNVPTARAAAERLLLAVADGCEADPNRPRGCLLVHGALACSGDAESVRQELIARRAGTERALRERFEQAVATGELTIGQPADLARFVATVLEGMAVRTSGGATVDDLRRIAETAMRAWPAAAGKTRKKR